MADSAELERETKARQQELQDGMGYHFRDLALLARSLVHSSYAYEHGASGQDNETLEFLGDAVLDLAVGAMLYTHLPGVNEGELTRLRAALVNETNLAHMARGIRLGSYLSLGKGEDITGGREKPSILSCAYEALIGAIFLDSGYESAAEFIERYFVPVIDRQRDFMLHGDAKSRLQEKIQEKYHEAPTYRIDQEEGPAHDKIFTVSVLFRNTVLGFGRAGNKKEAEQQAAASALSDLPENLDD